MTRRTANPEDRVPPGTKYIVVELNVWESEGKVHVTRPRRGKGGVHAIVPEGRLAAYLKGRLEEAGRWPVADTTLDELDALIESPGLAGNEIDTLVRVRAMLTSPQAG